MLYDNNHLIYDEKGILSLFSYKHRRPVYEKPVRAYRRFSKEAYADFDLCRCGGALHYCQSMDGDLLYLKYIDEKWHNYTLAC